MKANEQDQKAYNLIVQQAMEFVTDNGPKLEGMIKTSGPVEGVVKFIGLAMHGITQAAQSAGVQLQGHTIFNALQEVVGVLVSILGASGLVKDVKGTAVQIMESLEGAQNGAA